MKPFFLLIFLCAFQSCSAQWKCETMAKLPDKLQESSGLVFENTNSFWTLNDGGDIANLYNIDSTGKILKTVHLEGYKNYDWEALHLADNGYLYIGDFGNNANVRKHLRVLKLEFSKLISGEALEVKELEFTYEDQTAFPPADDQKNFDCEAMVVVRDSIYLITKNRTKPFDGLIHIYAMPDKPGQQIAHRLMSYDSGIRNMYNGWATDADLYNKHLYILSHNKLYKLPNFAENPKIKRKLKTFKLGSFSQKEAMAFGEGSTFYMTDEKFGALKPKLYKVSLP